VVFIFTVKRIDLLRNIVKDPTLGRIIWHFLSKGMTVMMIMIIIIKVKLVN
jgi:hypothetical protein